MVLNRTRGWLAVALFTVTAPLLAGAPDEVRTQNKKVTSLLSPPKELPKKVKLGDALDRWGTDIWWSRRLYNAGAVLQTAWVDNADVPRVVRASPHYYNTEEEVELVCKAVEGI